jgi:hypothetical protein
MADWHADLDAARQAGGIVDNHAWCDACITHARDPARVVSRVSKDGAMEGLRWWLLLLTALMFSMSGCASREWMIWATNPAHFASAQHLAFSVKGHPTEASITEEDMQAAAREEWWGRLVPEGPDAPGHAPYAPSSPDAPGHALYAPSSPDATQAALPSMDMTGKWRGTWISRGLFGDERSSTVFASFSQSGKSGLGRIALDDVNAATGLPQRVREAGSAGIPVFYKVDGVDVVARDQVGTSVKVTFTRVGDTIYGKFVGAPAPTVLVLEREPQ